MTNIHSLKGVLFDLDGTLLDHFECLYQCVHFVTEQLGKPIPSHDEVKRAIGGGVPHTLTQFVGQENVVAGLEFYRTKYEEVSIPTAKLIDGAMWLLEGLGQKDLKLGLLTNKPIEDAKIICAHTRLSDHLPYIYGAGDTIYFKPDVRFTQFALDQMQLSAKDCIYIGDTHFDILTAHAVGMRCLIVTSGAQSRDTILAHSPQPDAIYDNLWELGQCFFDLKLPQICPAF